MTRTGSPWGLLLKGLKSPWLHPLNHVDALEPLLAAVNPLWSIRHIRARVVAVIDETADTRTFVLRPNRHWPGFRAGQHVAIEVDIEGVRHHRTYSLSSGPERNGQLQITVKRQAVSKVSAWLHTHLRPGSVVALSGAAGSFGLPESTPERILLLSAGSGITPMMAMLDQLERDAWNGDVVVVHSCRDAADLIFAERLRALALLLPRMQLHIHHTATDGRLDPELLREYVPDFAERFTALCGPRSLMGWVRECYAAAGASDRLVCEDFRGGLAVRGEGADALSLQVHCAVSSRRFQSAGAQALLIEAEDAGLSPKHGCRAGICRTCLCRKRSGRVENLLTGVICDEPDRWIQLCVSVARSDVEIEL
jgi:stearoyl-CoA 9-desaturase NADPH oxidoreductase